MKTQACSSVNITSPGSVVDNLATLQYAVITPTSQTTSVVSQTSLTVIHGWLFYYGKIYHTTQWLMNFPCQILAGYQTRKQLA